MLFSKKIIPTTLLLASLALGTQQARASEFLIGVAISVGVVTALNYMSDGSNERKEVAIQQIHDDAAAYAAGMVDVPTATLKSALDESRKQMASQGGASVSATMSDQDIAKEILKLNTTTLLSGAPATATTGN
jgi:hypothetical protein